MVQTVIIILLFVAALTYIGRLIYKSFNAKKACGGNCKCGVDLSQVKP